MLKNLFHTIHSKITLSSFALVMLCLNLFGVISFNFIAKELKENNLQASHTIVSRVDDSIEEMIEQLDNLSKIIATNPHTVKLLKENTESIHANNSLLFIQDYMTSLIAFRSDIVGIFLSDLDAKAYSFGSNANFLPKYALENEAWFQAFCESDALSTIIPPHSNKSYSNYPILSFVRKIKVLDQKEPIGLVKIDIKMDFFESLGEVHNSSAMHLIILDSNNQCIYPAKPFNSIPLYVERLKKETTAKGYFTLDTKERQEIVTYQKSPYTGLTLLLCTDKKHLLYNLPILIFKLIKTALLCSLIGFLLSLAIGKPLSRSIKNLAGGIKDVEKGDFTVNVPITSQDEVGYLTEQFNKMVLHINELIHTNNEINKKNVQAEMKVLQSQINPHFLYNTLESIRMKAIANKPEEASFIIEQLGDLLKFNLRNTNDFVSLEQELVYLEKYILLHNIRLRYKIIYDFPTDDFLDTLYIPKFLLQPIVENAIVHGLEPIKERYIEISVAKLQHSILINIYNNGTAIPVVQLDTLNTLLENNDVSYNGHIGLLNVNNRLKLLYGDDCGVAIDSTTDGTTITLILKEKTLDSIL